MMRAIYALIGWKGSVAAILALVLSLAGWGQLRYWKGHRAGVAKIEAEVEEERQRRQHQLFQLADALSMKSTELETAKAMQADLAGRLENEARADPDAPNRVPSAGSLRRLELRWRH